MMIEITSWSVAVYDRFLTCQDLTLGSIVHSTSAILNELTLSILVNCLCLQILYSLIGVLVFLDLVQVHV